MHACCLHLFAGKWPLASTASSSAQLTAASPPPPPSCPQILLNLRRGNSGELSLGTCALSFVGNLARVYTTATLVKDPLILGSAATQASGQGEWRGRVVCTRRSSCGAVSAAPLRLACGTCQRQLVAARQVVCPDAVTASCRSCSLWRRRCSTASWSGSASRRRGSCA